MYISIFFLKHEIKQVRKNLIDGEPVYRGELKTSLEGDLLLKKGQQIEGF